MKRTSSRNFLVSDNKGIGGILEAVILAITFVLAIVVIFNVVASIDGSEIDDTLETELNPNINETAGHNMTFAGNSTSSLLDNIGTFFTVGPIILIVVAAIMILSYILALRGRRD